MEGYLFVYFYDFHCYKKKLTRLLSTDVFHSWLFQYAFDPETTSDVVYGVEASRFDCECPVPSESRATNQTASGGLSKRGRRRRTERPVRTKPPGRLGTCFNPETTSDAGMELRFRN